MKHLALICSGFISAAALLTTEASAETVNGVAVVNLTGGLRVAGTGYTTVDCKAYVLLIPTTTNTVTLTTAGVLSWLYSGDQSASAHVGFDYLTAGSTITGVKPSSSSAGSVSGFHCNIRVPYTFTNAVGGQSLAVMYEVKAKDNSPCVQGYCAFPPTYPGGHAREMMEIVAPPANGGTISLSAQPRL
jgi:hypothetical protein